MRETNLLQWVGGSEKGKSEFGTGKLCDGQTLTGGAGKSLVSPPRARLVGTLVVKVLGDSVQQSEKTLSNCYVIEFLQLSQERKYYRDVSTLSMCHFSQ